jgi:hypothetical protein
VNPPGARLGLTGQIRLSSLLEARYTLTCVALGGPRKPTRSSKWFSFKGAEGEV